MDKTSLIQKLTAAAFSADAAQLEIALTALTRKNDKRKFLTAKTAAEVCGMHRETILRYGRAGILNPVRVGRRKLRFDADEVMRLANGELLVVNQ